MAKKFYEFAKTEVNCYPALNEVIYPHCPTCGEDSDVFLIYAENEKEAFQLALEHRHEGRPLERFYGTYKNEKYSGEVMCVM